MERQRSPSYPSLSLEQAIDMVAKLHKANRTNVVGRETAAKDLGYTGLTGRSLTVLAALAQYGLVERAGKGDIKVTRRAVEILHPVEDAHRVEAIKDAAAAPSLFRDLEERFPDGMPSNNALRSYLVQRDFNDVAIGQAIGAFLDTITFVAKTEESGRTGETSGGDDDGGTNPPSQELVVQTAASPSPPPSPLGPKTASLVPASALAFASGPMPPLNKISMNVKGTQVHLEALLDRDGIARLRKKLDSLEALLDDEDGRPDDEDLDPRD